MFTSNETQSGCLFSALISRSVPWGERHPATLETKNSLPPGVKKTNTKYNQRERQMKEVLTPHTQLKDWNEVNHCSVCLFLFLFQL